MDISLYYQEKGQGRPFILLHGNGENGSYFSRQLDFFSDRYRMIAVDTRGHGRSPRGTAPFTLKQFAEDLNEFMIGMGISKAILLGFSDGANIALEFALRHSDKIEALILDGGNLNARGVKRSVQIPIEIGYRIAKILSRRSETAKYRMELLGLMVNEPDIKPEELRSIQAPTLVIAGTEDMIKRAHTEEIAKHIPNAKLSIIQGDHFIANKEADRFNKEVERFLRDVIG